MKQSFFVPGKLPGQNDILAAAKSGGGKTNAYHRLKIYWEGIIVQYIRAANIKPMDSARITFLWVEANKRRNPDNIAAAKKFLIDAMVTAGIFQNDGWNQILGFDDGWVLGDHPGVYVRLTDYEGG